MLNYIIVDIADLSDEVLKCSFEYMSSERKEKVVRIKNINQKKCTLAGEWLARKMLAEVSGNHPETFMIMPDAKGKLHSKNTPELFFNISHSQNIVAVAVSDKTVGIDIEKIRPVSLKLAKRVCRPDELAYVFKTDCVDYDAEHSEDVLHRFFEIWTIKEAYFKCIGTGITDFMSVDAINGNFRKKKIIDKDCIIHIVTSE